MSLIQVSRRLSKRLAPLEFAAPVDRVYDPLTYAKVPHEAYLKRFGGAKGRVVLLGMNPGPWGMAQTGVPFGDVGMVRDWMGINEAVGSPPDPHPKRPVQGFACTRKEGSGSRLWGWARDRFGTPEAFFERFFVLNYCPLLFLEESGKNRVPEKLPVTEREPLMEACDDALRKRIKALEPAMVLGVGVFAEGRAKTVLGESDFPIGRILHPSPASPAANRGWVEAAEKQFAALGVDLD